MNKCSHCDAAMLAKSLCEKHYREARRVAARGGPARVPMNAEQRAIAAKATKARYNAKHPGAAAQSSRKWKAAHPEYATVNKSRQLEYAARNREQEKARSAKWRAEYPNEHKATKAAYYRIHAVEVKAKNYAYREKNPELYRELSRSYKASKRAGGGRLKPGYLKRLLEKQGGICGACRCDLSVSGHHVDHIHPISKGGLHAEENLQLLCPSCNLRKSDKEFAAFLTEAGFGA